MPASYKVPSGASAIGTLDVALPPVARNSRTPFGKFISVSSVNAPRVPSRSRKMLVARWFPKFQSAPILCQRLPSNRVNALLTAAQKAALAQSVKRPMLVVNTLLSNGKALQKLRIKGAQLPGSFLQDLFLVCGINVGGYHPAWRTRRGRHERSFSQWRSRTTSAKYAGC